MKFESVKLGDLYEVHNGLSKGRQYFGEGYPFLSFSTVFNNWFLPESLQDLVRSDEKEQKSYSIHRGDVFITRTSETMDELGMSSVALKDYPKATYNGFVKRLRPIDNRVLPEYIGYYLRTPNFRSKFMSLTGSMISRASLRNESLLDMEVLLPSIEEQQKIASYLSVYDDLIENNQRRIQLLEEYMQRHYLAWLNNAISFVKVRAGDYFDISIGKTPPRSESKWFAESGNSVKWISISDMANTSVFCLDTKETLTREAIEKFNIRVVPKDTIVVSFKLTVGRVAITTSEMCTNEAIAHFNTDNLYMREYAYNYLKNFRWGSLGSTSAISTAINSKIVKSMDFLVPEEKDLRMFSLQQKPVFDEIMLLTMQNKKMIKTRNLLISRIFSGTLEV